MDLYPAIDLLDGRCVRLYQGDYDQSTVYGDDPVAQALAFQSEGAPWVHVVDLDAARTGEPRNRDVVAAIAGALDVPVQTGGGVRTVEAADALFAAGVAVAVIESYGNTAINVINAYRVGGERVIIHRAQPRYDVMASMIAANGRRLRPTMCRCAA